MNIVVLDIISYYKIIGFAFLTIIKQHHLCSYA